MRRPLLRAGLLWLALAGAAPANAGDLAFGVIRHAERAARDEAVLRAAIDQSDVDNLGFVVAIGIKSSAEPCGDNVYGDRKTLLDSAKNGLVVALAASDWIGCKNEAGKSVALERLARLRELFFSDDFSQGGSRIPLIRQSTTPKFRSYVENARWEFDDILFATINLPANNNHYLSAAGRNSEFEDRQVANRHWLQRLFVHATNKKLRGIVLFCDGDPLAPPRASELRGRYDGFADMRQRINALARKFPGRVLVVHGPAGNRPAAPARIAWRGNLGSVTVNPGWLKISAREADPMLFAVTGETPP